MEKRLVPKSNIFIFASDKLLGIFLIINLISMISYELRSVRRLVCALKLNPTLTTLSLLKKADTYIDI